MTRLTFKVLLSNIPFGAFELVVAILIVILFLATPFPPQQMEYIPNAVTGCITLSGILVAFTGFWVTRLYSNSSSKTKKWLTKRIAVIIFLSGLSLFFAVASLNELVYHDVEIAMQRALFGVQLIFFADLEVIFMVIYKAFTGKEVGS